MDYVPAITTFVDAFYSIICHTSLVERSNKLKKIMSDTMMHQDFIIQFIRENAFIIKQQPRNEFDRINARRVWFYQLLLSRIL
mmetsp:Transcript_6218/g.7720  ORF Transcript_6218/g.7720 Transcript_6218/m.7720 type:complete len:83 (-) Transcript_6218:50-298(-)